MATWIVNPKVRSRGGRWRCRMGRKKQLVNDLKVERELTPTAPPTKLAVCDIVVGTVVVLTLQLSLPVMQLLLLLPLAVIALEQICTST